MPKSGGAWRGALTRRAFQAAAVAGVTGLAVKLSAGPDAPKAKAGAKAGTGLPARPVLPPDDPWNLDVAGEPVDPRSDAILRRVGLDKPLHPDFGTVYQGVPMGMSYVVVPGTQPKVPVKFDYDWESDPGSYPIPDDAPIEGGPASDGDRHVLVIDRDNWVLYELYSARRERNGRGWTAGSGAIFDLKLKANRPAGWTSADAAGLPVFPGLVRYDEVAEARLVRHAFRFTVKRTRRAYVPPARHYASKLGDADLPPMGMRVRLKKAFDVGRFPPQSRVVLTALQAYGMLLADNGSDWFLSGAHDPRWDDEDLAALKRVKVRDFEVVRMGEVTVG